MVIVKISDKQQLDELMAKITMRLGRKPTQQEILDSAILLADKHMDELLENLMPFPKLDQAKFDRIKIMQQNLAKVEWFDGKENESEIFYSQDDGDIYGV